MIRILGPALVLQQFNTDPSTGRVFIVGRQPGFVGWLLAAIGVDAKTELGINPTEVMLRQSSVFGETVTSLPVSRVASVSAGYAKPVEYLILAVLFAWTCIVPLVMLVLFYLEKRVFVWVETVGSGHIAIAFKRSIIEGVTVDEERAKEVVAILQRNILASASLDGRGAGAAMMHAQAHAMAPQQPR